METPIDKLRKTRGIPILKGSHGNMARNVSSYYPHNISLDLLRKQFHSFLDLNQPAQIESPDQYNIFAGYEVSFRVNLFFYLYHWHTYSSMTLISLIDWYWMLAAILFDGHNVFFVCLHAFGFQRSNQWQRR